MTISALKEKAEAFYPAIIFDSFFPYAIRKWIRLLLLLIALFTIVGLSHIIVPLGYVVDKELYVGIFFISFSLWIFMHLLEGMYFSYYFHDHEMYYEVAKILTHHQDLTVSFLTLPIGKYVMHRCGLSEAEVKSFLKTRKKTLTSESFVLTDITPRDRITLADFGYNLIKYDEDLAYFLFERGIGEDVFRGAIDWVSANMYLMRNAQRWWSRAQLSTIPSLGKNWSYGQVPMLERYASLVDTHFTPLTDTKIDRLFSDDVIAIEQVLMKSREANAIIISDDGLTGVDIIRTMASHIARGISNPYFEDKRIFIMHGTSFLESAGDLFVQDFQALLNEAQSAGNIILVIEHLASFVERAHAKGIDVVSIMEPYLNSSVSVIALSDTKGYHRTLESEVLVTRFFEKVVAHALDEHRTLVLLQNEVYALETKHGVLFSYPSLIAVVQSAQRYFGEAVLADKALDIIHEIIPDIKSQGKKLIKKEDVLHVIETKTHIPQGVHNKENKETLLNLEAKLHDRVVGQQAAITSIAKTLRRVNAGVSRTKRPMGTFLFAGPTGVGKTETAKALADIFFGGADNLIRFDMTEYSGSDGLQKLIGSTNGTVGALASALRERQYGVLLLDEFEKAHSDVHNLFLQILDEGIFTDTRGEAISARNVVVIATSNAGSELWDSSTISLSPEDKRAQLVEYIIDNRIFKPELLNRFDNIVVYDALKENDLRGIARLQVYALRDRLKQQGIDLEINPFILSYVVSKGSSTQFGAREMQRAIADSIESAIAEKIIAEDVHPGDTIAFSPAQGEGEFTITIAPMRKN